MNNKAFSLSLVLALLAVFMVYSYIGSKEEEYKTKYGTEVAVVVAKRDIAELEMINDTMIEIINKPKRYVEPGSLTSKEEAADYVTLVPLKKGEQITLTKIVPPGVKTGLAKQISPGKRAVSINVNDSSAVNRLIKPGDRVDLVAVVEPPGSGRGNQVAKMVMQDVPVLAVGEYVTSQPPRKLVKNESTDKMEIKNLNTDRTYNTITVETDPATAMQIVLLNGTTTIYVLMRNVDDTERTNIGGVFMTDLLRDEYNRIRGTASQR